MTSYITFSKVDSFFTELQNLLSWIEIGSQTELLSPLRYMSVIYTRSHSVEVRPHLATGWLSKFWLFQIKKWASRNNYSRFCDTTTLRPKLSNTSCKNFNVNSQIKSNYCFPNNRNLANSRLEWSKILFLTVFVLIVINLIDK